MRKWYGFTLIELLVVIAIDIIYTERKTQPVQETYVERT
jgi:Tfp pilus assembly protein PilE